MFILLIWTHVTSNNMFILLIWAHVTSNNMFILLIWEHVTSNNMFILLIWAHVTSNNMMFCSLKFTIAVRILFCSKDLTYATPVWIYPSTLGHFRTPVNQYILITYKLLNIQINKENCYHSGIDRSLAMTHHSLCVRTCPTLPYLASSPWL